jgi:hypothetical protein
LDRFAFLTDTEEMTLTAKRRPKGQAA